MIKEIDEDNDGINYSEFIAAAIDLRQIVKPQRIQAIFHQLDTGNIGKITEEELHFAFQKFGEEIKKEELRQMIKMHDIKGKGFIDFEDFQRMFLTKN